MPAGSGKNIKNKAGSSGTGPLLFFLLSLFVIVSFFCEVSAVSAVSVSGSFFQSLSSTPKCS